MAEDTELLLSPLYSLVKQLGAASISSAPLEMKLAGKKATEEAPLSIATTENDPVLVDDLNRYVRSIFLTTEGSEMDDITASHTLTIRTRKIRHSNSQDGRDTKKASTRHPTEPSTVFVSVQRPLRSYRVIQLLRTSPHAFPACGIVVGDISDGFGLYFHTCCDTLEAQGVYCISGTDHLYSASKSRPLLNLKNRAMVIDRVMREGGLRPSDESMAMATVDRSTSSMMSILGIATISTPTSTTHALPAGSDDNDAMNRRVDRACAEIGAFWSLLPGTETAKTHLLTADPRTGPARIVFATLYAFASLLKESVTHRLKRKFEVVLSAITTALLLCPCFALTSANDLNNTNIIAYVDPYTGYQTKIDLRASRQVFTEKMTDVAKCFVVEGATKVMIT